MAAKNWKYEIWQVTSLSVFPQHLFLFPWCVLFSWMEIISFGANDICVWSVSSVMFCLRRGHISARRVIFSLWQFHQIVLPLKPMGVIHKITLLSKDLHNRIIVYSFQAWGNWKTKSKEERKESAKKSWWDGISVSVCFDLFVCVCVNLNLFFDIDTTQCHESQFNVNEKINDTSLWIPYSIIVIVMCSAPKDLSPHAPKSIVLSSYWLEMMQCELRTITTSISIYGVEVSNVFEC